MSGDQTRLVLDGCAYTRTEKVELLCNYPTALRTLKVCWEGSAKERNCGVCEKCIRTKMNLMTVGVPNALCFDEPLNPADILCMRVRNDTQLPELQTILDYACKRGIDGLWVQNLRQRIDACIARKQAESNPVRGLRHLFRLCGALARRGLGSARAWVPGVEERATTRAKRQK